MLVLFVVLVLVVLLLILDFVKKRQFDKISSHIPAVLPSYPLIGNALTFTGKSQQQKFEIISSCFRKTQRIAKVWAGPIPIILVVHPDLVQKVLTDSGCCDRPIFYQFLGLNDTVFTAEYASWKPQRKKMNSTFSAKTAYDFIPVFEKCSQLLVAKIRSNLQGTPVDIFEQTIRGAFHMFLTTTIGVDGKNQSENDQFLDCLRRYINGVTREAKIVRINIFRTNSIIENRVTSGLLLIDVIYRLTKDYHVEKDDLSKMEKFCLKIINEKRKVAKNKSDDDERQSKTFIDQLLSMFNSEDERTTKILINQIKVMITAGADTVGVTVGFTCLFLAMFPHHQERLTEEIQANFPSKDSAITPESLTYLPLLDRIIKESMRVAPVPTLIGRRNITDIKLDGHLIPRGTTVALDLFDLHRRPEVWGPHADQFDPDHFLPERIKGRHPFGYLPFSYGMRNCIGWRYAMVSTKVMLIHILREFRLKTDTKFSDLKFTWSISLNLVEKALIVLEPRS